MYEEIFVTDMAVESVDKASFQDLTKKTMLSYGIEQRFVNLKNEELAKKIGRERGVYITFDTPIKNYQNNKACESLEKYIANSIVELVGIVKKNSPVFVVGLGNIDVVADSLGSKTVDKIAVNRHNPERRIASEQCICALSAGVYGATGIQSIEVVKSLTDTIKPSVVILVDSFATSSVTRLGASYQLSTSGISPGSGVGQNKERIDKSVLGVPVVSIGVPLVLSMRTVVHSFVSSYISDLGCENNEYKLREKLLEYGLSNLVVAPKDIKYLVDFSSNIIANAINKAFSLN